MISKYKLSIMVVTMNRAEQLKEALISCLISDLPERTQFVIIDNASTDNTHDVVKEVLSGREYYYERMETNLGVGGGRNQAYSKAEGEYVYSLDDDAVIDSKDLFQKAIDILDSDSRIITLSTQIYDTMLKDNRVLPSELKPYTNNLFLCHMFYGGSHFIRRSFFYNAPYLANKYGREELYPSLLVWDSGKVNVVDLDIRIIHKPAENRWEYKNNIKNQELVINDCAIKYTVKKMMYPLIFQPIILIAFKARCKKHLKGYHKWESKTKQMIKNIESDTPISEKVNCQTVIMLYSLFGMSAF